MDNFRWILLAVGIVIIVIIYLISRKNKREFYQYDDDVSEDLPEVKTSNWDDLDEGVGEVRIVARAEDVDLQEDQHKDAAYADDQYGAESADAINEYDRPAVERTAVHDPQSRLNPETEPGPLDDVQAESEPQPVVEQKAEAEVTEAVLVLNILARDGSALSGKSINSVAHANNMEFGEMDIYHRMDENNQPLFSMINMVKPGSFDPSTIHELTTPGVSLFLQLPGPANASDAFDDMLQTASRMSEVLEARLCDKSRQPLTESVVEQYRDTAASFDGKN